MQRTTRTKSGRLALSVLGLWAGLLAACGAGGGSGPTTSSVSGATSIAPGDTPADGGDAAVPSGGNGDAIAGSAGTEAGVADAPGLEAEASASADGAVDGGPGARVDTDSGDADFAADTGSGVDATVVNPGSASPSVTKDSENVLTNAGIDFVSFGGYINGESFQKDGIVTFQGYQYAAFWNTSRHVVLARRALPTGAWMTIEFTDYTNGANDAHNTISIGICPGDGTLHLSFDHHVSPLHYRRSVAGFVTNPTSATWASSSFSAVSDSLVNGAAVGKVTYPKFITEPDGKTMLMELRIGNSGSGDEYLWEYSSGTHAWAALGRYIYGTVDSIDPYPHGLSYTPGGTRLNMSWCWRETSNASTNHDLLYIYSDDNGRTWKNTAGTSIATTGSSPVTKASAGTKVWTINQNRGLINEEHMAVDSAGRVHVLLSHMPDSQPDDPTFDSARTKSVYFDYWMAPAGTWTRVPMGQAAVASFRGKLAISSSNNVYAVLPDMRIAATSPASNFGSWTLLSSVDSGRFFSDPLIDTARLALEDKLSVFYPQKASPNIFVLDYSLR